MFRALPLWSALLGSHPRVSGDVSTVQVASVRLLPSSPRERGCFWAVVSIPNGAQVIPA